MKEDGIMSQVNFIPESLEENITVKTLLDSIAEGVVVINEEGIINLVNERMTKLTGYEKHEMTGKRLDILIPHNLRSKHRIHLKNYFRNLKKRPMGAGMNLTAKRKDGSTLPIEISLSYLRSKSGILGVAFITDITLRKKADDELKQKNKELEQYAHTVAHNINSLLNGIVGFSELLINSWGVISKANKLKYLENISQNSWKLSNVANELLVFASMKREDVEMVKINMRKNVEDACNRFKLQINQKSAQIQISEIMHDCFGYGPWIEEVWYNYLSNALKYGGEPPLIYIKSEEADNGYIKYSVTDNGEGISEELKPIIFEENNSSKDKMTKGFGFGLAMVKRIIEKLDGYVSVESKPGEGCTFNFFLKGI